MAIKYSRRRAHRALRIALVALFMGQGVLKSIIFLMPGTIAFFEHAGLPGWIPAAVVLAEFYLIMQMGLMMAGFYQMPPEGGRSAA